MSKLRSWVLAVVCAFKSTQSISPVANKYFLNLNLWGINWDTLFVLQLDKIRCLYLRLIFGTKNTATD